MDIRLYNNIPPTMLEDEYLLLQDLYIKGDDIQKLSVIQALPQLLQYDPNGTLTRIVPKIQQELPKSSCEFHIATSKIFKLLIEKQLPLNLTSAVIQGTESKDPIVSNAWIETLLAVISVLPIEQIKSSVLPLALSKSQPSSPVYCRVASCKILGKCAAHAKIESIDVKTTILPAVQSLCQDCFQDVRATMCSQLHFIAQGLGENLVKSSLLPSLVELASDDNAAVRSAAVAAAVLVIPFLNKQTKVETIVPLIKQLCQKPAGGIGDTTFPTMAKEFGRLVDALQNDLDTNDCTWILQFYKTLGSKGQTVRLNKDNFEVTQDIICREQCAFNLPAVTLFTVNRISSQLELWHSVFSGLVNDSCYIVRKTTAGCVHEVAKILGPQCKLIKDDVVKLLRDDAEEVLHMLVPHIGATLELFCANGVLSRETTLPAAMELTRSLLKCQVELSKSFNWRIKTDFLQQLERLPNCMPSDFIHQHFSPMILNCVLETRPKPLRSQASKTLLIFLRYNIKEIQRKWIRDNLISYLCYSKSCYTRHVFILACVHAMELFSNSYFKKHFFEPLLSLADDPVSNIRICVVGLLPTLFKMLVMPDDRKLQTSIDSIFSKLDMMEKDRDVKDILKVKLKEIRTSGPTNKHEYMVEQRRKEEEENKIGQGKCVTTNANATPPAVPTGGKATPGHISREQSVGSNRSHPTIARSTSAPSRVTKSGSQQIPSEMSFLEQHFYIDAGVSLPREKIGIGLERTSDMEISDMSEKMEQLDLASTPHDDSSMIPTVSVENIDIETMSESDLKKLETSTTNITDDVKVNLRKRNKKSLGKTNTQKTTNQSKDNTGGCNLRTKRYSSIIPTVYMNSASNSNSTVTRKSLNRRSLNIGVGDTSKIPVCLKKSKSNADVKHEEKIDSNKMTTTPNNTSRNVEDSSCRKNYELQSVNKIKSKIRPKSEIFMHCESQNKWTSLGANVESTSRDTNAICNNDSIKNNVAKANSIKDNTLKTSGLPILKRRTASEARKQ